MDHPAAAARTDPPATFRPAFAHDPHASPNNARLSQPKVVAASAAAVNAAIVGFGVPPVAAKPILKALPALLGNPNTLARDQGKVIALSLHQRIGSPVEARLKDIKPVLLKELADSWSAQGEDRVQRQGILREPAATLHHPQAAEGRRLDARVQEEVDLQRKRNSFG